LKDYKQRKFIIVIFFITGLFLIAGCQVPKPSDLISQKYPSPGDSISAFSSVGVTFSQPVQESSVEVCFSVSPPIAGNMSWAGNTLWFRPLLPYDQEGEYQVRLYGSIKTRDGDSIAVDQSWEFTIRQPKLIYLREGEIWRADQDGAFPRQLSSSNNRVLEFSADRSGEWVVFTIQNEFGGQNILVVDREGDKQQLLVDCTRDQCREPAWSVNQEWVAYTRASFNQDTGGFGPAQIWKVEVETAETYPLGGGKGLLGNSPSFSPDGEKLAYYDAKQKGIQILDLRTLEQTFIPSNIEGSGDWSQDGQRILFTDHVTSANQQSVLVKIYDLTNGETIPAFDEEVADTDFSQPQWMPGEVWIAASVKPINDNGNKALWVIPLKDTIALRVSNTPSANFSAYTWDPWGKQLVFQQLTLTSSDSTASIWVWDWESKESVLIIEDGSLPLWLP
jgi:Tol biopolymer transport system component